MKKKKEVSKKQGSKKKVVKKVHKKISKKPVKKIKKPIKHHAKKEGFFEEFTDLFHHKKSKKRKPAKKSGKNSHKKVKKKVYKKVKPIVHKHVKKVHQHKKISKKHVKKVHKKPVKKHVKKVHKKVKHVVHKSRKKPVKKHSKKAIKHVKNPMKIISKKHMGKKGSIKKPTTKHPVKKEGFFEEFTDLFRHKKNKKAKLEKDLKKIESKTKKVSKGKGVKSKGIKKSNKKIVAKPNAKLNKKIEKIKKNLQIKKDIKKPIKIAKVVNKIKKELVKKQLMKKSLKTGKLGSGPPILTGIKGFDALFAGKTPGIPQGASILIEGGPGSGKTLFCLTTLYNLCKQGKKCLYMSFEEPEERLIHHMENFGWNPKELIRKGKLRITRFDAIDVSRSIEALLSAAKKELLIDIDPVFFPQDFNADFVVIDSLTSIASAFSGEESRFRIYMEQLFRYLERNKIANFLIREVSSPSHIGTTFKEQGEAVSFLSDGIVVIYNVIYDSGGRSSAIEILKMRGVNFSRKIVELKIIDGKGLEINPNKILNKTKKANFSLT